jgi:polyisoprenoid-binding protein YceI
MTTTTQTPSVQTSSAQDGQLAGTWHVDAGGSHARFKARTIAGLVGVPGRFRTLAGALSLDGRDASGALIMDAASIDTGNRLRDWHLRSSAFLGAAKHPQLRYEVDSVELDGASVRIDGDLLVADSRAWVPLAAELRHHDDGAVQIACRAQLDRLELGIRGARGMVPRMVDLDIAVMLRRAS